MSSARWIRGLLEASGTIVYPPHCAVCSRAVGRARAVLCHDCRRELPRLEGPRCGVCGEPFGGALTGPFRCMNCGDRELAFQFAASAFRSRGPVREMIHQFKYRGRHHLRHMLARMLWRGFLDPRVVRLGLDAVVPVPLHEARRREREFNQSEVLARLAARRLRLPVRDCLVRVRHTRTQTNFHREERFGNLEGAFALKAGADVADLRLALVDDVLTTGSTADACARVLVEAGAAVVVVITVARG